VRTDDLIDALSANAGPAPGAGIPRRLLAVAAFGVVLTLALILSWLRLRADLDQAMLGRMFWMKAGYTAVLAVAGFWACERLSRPAGSGRKAFWLAGGVLVLFVGIGIVQMMLVDPEQRMVMIRGRSIQHCLQSIVLLGLPMLAVALIALRDLAPTRPTLAGFAAGLFSGAVCATVYGLHCGESSMMFVGAWYSLGVLLVGLLGAVIGRWALRW
jgi:hypothetical protein